MVTSGANVWVSVEESLNLNKKQHAVGTGEKDLHTTEFAVLQLRSMTSIHW